MEREYSTASDADSQTVLQNKNKAAQIQNLILEDISNFQ
jgi:hypothetical protein